MPLTSVGSPATPGGRVRRAAAFPVAVTSLITVFIAAGVPVPLMRSYREAGLANADFAFASCAYFVAAAVGLVVLGRLSGFVGRRRVGIAAVLIAATGSLLMVDIHSASGLMASRGLQGLACGIAPGALGAYVVDTAGSRRWLAALFTGSSPMIGMPVGALGAGLLVQFGVGAGVPLVVVVCLLSGCAVLLWLCEETVVKVPGAWRSLVPRLAVPDGARAPALVAADVFVATWPLAGFYQAFGSIVSAEVLGASSVGLSGAIFASIMVLNPVGGVLAALLPPRVGIIAGLFTAMVALVGVAVSVVAASPLTFVGASMLCGGGQGIAATSAIRIMLERATQVSSAGVIATIYFLAYLSVAFTGVLAGIAAPWLPLRGVALGYVGFGVVTAGVTLAVLLRRVRLTQDADRSKVGS